MKILWLYTVYAVYQGSPVLTELCPPSVTMVFLLVTEREGKESQSNYPQVMLIVVSGLSRLSICKVSSDEFLHYLLLM